MFVSECSERVKTATLSFKLNHKLHIGRIGSGPEPAELQATQWQLRWRTGAGGHRGSPQPESWTGGGAASVQTRRAGVCAPLDWDNLLGLATRLLRLE